MTRLAPCVLALVIAVLASACSGGSDSGGSDRRVEVTFRAFSLSGGPLRGSELDRAVTILEERLDQAGIRSSVTQGSSSRVFVHVDRAGPTDGERIVELATRTGLLEIFDLEKNLVGPSIDHAGFPVAAKSRKILGAPPETVALECGIGEEACPGVFVENPRTNFHYLFRYDPPLVPELDGGDVQLDGVRQDFDTTTGEPVVIMQFTNDGAVEFEELTNALADRGKARFNLSGGSVDPLDTYQHLAIVFDREIKSWPSIDWEQYPNGISGTNGAQISGLGNLQEAKDLALVLRTGALPVRLEPIARRETTG